MNLIESLREKSEAERQRFEAELPILAERVAHGEATEKEVAAWMKSSGKNLNELQVAVDRQHEIERLKALAGLFRERSASAYRFSIQIGPHRAHALAVQRALEKKAVHLRVMTLQEGLLAAESQEAHRTLSELTGLPFPVPNMHDDYRAIDAEFAAAATAEAMPSNT